MSIHQFTDLDNIPLIFDEETKKIFFEEFCPEKKDYCSHCLSKDIVHDKDFFFCFKCKKRCSSKFWKIELINGYLAKTNENKIEYFHRKIMTDELNKRDHRLQIHHKNHNKLDNRKENLELIEKEKHQKYHQRKAYRNAYNTWVRKIYGKYIYEDFRDEFDTWLEKKNGELY